MLVLVRYSPFRQDYLQHDLQHDTSVHRSTNDPERQRMLKSLSSNILSGGVVLDDKQREPDCVQAIGYFPSQERSLFMAWQGIFAEQLKDKYQNFRLNSFYFNQSYLYDYHIKQQIINNEISRVHSSQYIFMKNYLLNVLLIIYGDRAEMAHSVEGRLAFLDHHLVDYVNQLPTNIKLKIKNGAIIEKYILKEAGRPYITDDIYRREKHPFHAPPTLLNPQSRVYQYIHETLNSQAMNQLEFLFDIKGLRESLNNLHRNQDQAKRNYSWGELALLEGKYLMVCSYLALAKHFHVQHD